MIIDLATAMLAHFETGNDCPRWHAFLDKVLPSKKSRFAFPAQMLLQEWAGYCLIPSHDFPNVLILDGSGPNGKSVIQRVLRLLVGTENCSSVHLSQVHLPCALEPLVGKLLNFSAEPIGMKKKTAEVLTQICDGQQMTITKPYHTSHQTVLPVRFCLETNDLEPIKSWPEALQRQAVILPFRVQIFPPEQRPLPELINEFSEELPGIFLWALEGLRRLVAGDGAITAT